MARFNLSVDVTVNTINVVEIKAPHSGIELDALIAKIEKDEITSTELLLKKLEAHNVEVISITPSTKAYYTNATVLEIEEVEE